MGLGKRQVQALTICTAGICLLLLLFLALPHHVFSPASFGSKAGHPELVKDVPIPSCDAGSVSAGKPQKGLSSHSVTLTWNASIAASRSARDIVRGYYIYRSQKSHKYAKSDRLNTDPIAGTSCIDKAVKPRVTYFYSVKSVSQGGMESEFSDEVKAVIPQH
jgi:hypothetical protein